MRNKSGALDWDRLKNPAVARPGDTLTINRIDDLGNETVKAMKIIDTLVKRGVKIVTDPVCENPIQLAGLHAKHRDRERRKKMHAAKKLPGVNKGGRPFDHSDEDIRRYHAEVLRGDYRADEIGAIQGISEMTMRRRCPGLGLEWPPVQRKGG